MIVHDEDIIVRVKENEAARKEAASADKEDKKRKEET